MGVLNKTLDQIDLYLHHKSVDPSLKKIENFINIPRKYIALVLVSLLSVGIFIGCLNQIIVIDIPGARTLPVVTIEAFVELEKSLKSIFNPDPFMTIPLDMTKLTKIDKIWPKNSYESTRKYRTPAPGMPRIVGFIYPAYKSIKAIESKSTEDDRKWLVYWVVYSTLIILEYFSDLLLFWFPMYYMIKSFLLIWCMHPNYNGSEFIYNNIIKPAFIKHEKKIDELVENVQTKGTGTFNKLVGEVGEIGEEVMSSEKVKENLAGLTVEGLKQAGKLMSSENLLGEEGEDESKDGKKDD